MRWIQPHMLFRHAKALIHAVPLFKFRGLPFSSNFLQSQISVWILLEGLPLPHHHLCPAVSSFCDSPGLPPPHHHQHSLPPSHLNTVLCSKVIMAFFQIHIESFVMTHAISVWCRVISVLIWVPQVEGLPVEVKKGSVASLVVGETLSQCISSPKSVKSLPYSCFSNLNWSSLSPVLRHPWLVKIQSQKDQQTKIYRFGCLVLSYRSILEKICP